jgi:3-deoxy-D-manno-octulosonic-acid transferase
MLWTLALPFLKKNQRLKPGFSKRISCSHLAQADIWIQAASAGEACLAARIIQGLSFKTKTAVLVTATTVQGIEILHTCLTGKKTPPSIDLRIDWFFFDQPDIMKKAVETICPRIMVLLETEIWPALIHHLKQKKAKILILNARLSKKSHGHYLKTKFIWKHLSPDIVLATSDRDARRYGQIFETAEIKTMPNIKFESIDRDSPDIGTRERIKKLLPPALPLTILASVRQEEEKEVLNIINLVLNRFPRQVVAIFPRHVHRIRFWEKRLTQSRLNFKLRSQIKSCPAGPGIVLWDRFGELKTACGFASIVFVGGSLKPLGGQNFIEPAVQGAVTVTGPYYDDFAWAGETLFTSRIVLKEKDWQSVARTILNALELPGNKSERKDRALAYLQSNRGGTRQACDEILKAFDVFF